MAYEDESDPADAILQTWINGNRSDALEALEFASPALVARTIYYACEAAPGEANRIVHALVTRESDRKGA